MIEEVHSTVWQVTFMVYFHTLMWPLWAAETTNHWEAWQSAISLMVSRCPVAGASGPHWGPSSLDTGCSVFTSCITSVPSISWDLWFKNFEIVWLFTLYLKIHLWRERKTNLLIFWTADITDTAKGLKASHLQTWSVTVQYRIQICAALFSNYTQWATHMYAP